MKKIFLTALLGVSAYTAQATISFDLQAEKLRNSLGANAPTSTLVMLVADTSGNGFGPIVAGSSLSVGSFLNGADDQILYKNNIASTTNTAGAFADFFNVTLAGAFNAGDPLALVWFPTLTLASSTTTAGDTYGRFSGPALDGSNAWVTPADGANGHHLYFFTTTATDLPAVPPGSNAASLGDASFAVAGVPEPSMFSLGMLGVAGVLLRRRRK